MEIISKIENIVKELNEVQDYIDSLPNQLSVVDSKRSDLEHGVEFNQMTTKGCYRLVQELKRCAVERRKIKNDMEIGRVLNLNINKIATSSTREFLLHELKKASGKLNQPYKNRVYTEEEMNYFLGRNETNEIME